MQRMMHLVIDVYNFGQEFFIIGFLEIFEQIPKNNFCYKRPFKYYISMCLAFLGPPTYVSINSNVNQQKLPFSDPTNLFADVMLEWSPIVQTTKNQS